MILILAHRWCNLQHEPSSPQVDIGSLARGRRDADWRVPGTVAAETAGLQPS
jgi:hypothetical protein